MLIIVSIILVGLVVTLFNGIFFWKIFEKAGVLPWKSLIPIYNYYYLVIIAKLPKWYFILIIIPLVFILLPKEVLKELVADPIFNNVMKDVGFLVNGYLCYKIAQAFSKNGLYALGLIFLPIIFFPILGFGSAEYDFTGATTLKKNGLIPPAPTSTPVSVYNFQGTMNTVTGGFASAPSQSHTEESNSQIGEKV